MTTSEDNLQEISRTLVEAAAKGASVFLRCEPEIWDFTDRAFQPSLSISSGKQFSTFSFSKDSLPWVLDALQLSVAAAGRKLICWDWKNLQTYAKAVTKKPFKVDCSVIDLKLMERYAGIEEEVPRDLDEALRRLRRLVDTKAWEESQAAYRKVLLPLATSVVPAMETAGMIDVGRSDLVFGHYEILGQENGRFKCRNVFSRGFVPHNIGPEEKAVLRPRDEDEIFLYFDFRSYEVAVLAWLSGDERLRSMLDGDFYSELYKLLTGKAIETEEQRDRSKKLFLPVIYGQHAPSLAKSLGVERPIAEKIIFRLQSLFSTAFDWLLENQKRIESQAYGSDSHGKRRYFPEEDSHRRARRIRNFLVQSPGSLFCLERLVRLEEAIRGVADLAFHVHDGYAIYASRKKASEAYRVANSVFSEESELFPGLRISTSCRIGRTLDALKPVKG